MVESIVAAWSFGTIWFWITTIIASIVIISCVENKHYPTPSLIVILFGAIYWKCIISLSWQTIIIAIAVYELIGIFWSIFKWYRQVHQKVLYYNRIYGEKLTEQQVETLKSEVSVTENKDMIVGWMVFWPWSLLWSITGDSFTMLYDAMANTYQYISNQALRKFKLHEPKKKELITNADVGYSQKN